MSTQKEGSKYVCRLDETSKEKARKELFERNDKDRDLAVESLRKWLDEQNYWLKSPTDYEFLLRFLRVRKFSQLEARKSIETYWTFKTNYPEIGMDLDPTDPILQEIFKTGIYHSSKKRDKDGCRVLICNLGRIPLQKVKSTWGKAALHKAYILVNEWLMFDENVQVNGMKQIWEYTDLQLETVRYFITNQHNQQVMKFLSKCMPARVKGLNTYNDPPYIDLVLSLFAPFLSRKIRDRLKTTGRNLCKLYEYVDMSVLPTEYLPDDYVGPSAGTEKQIIAAFKLDHARFCRQLKTTGPNLCKHYEYVDMSVLPGEYLPDDYVGPSAGTEKQIIGKDTDKKYTKGKKGGPDDVTLDVNDRFSSNHEMLADMQSPEFLNHIQKLSSTKYGVDLDKKPNGEDEIASFRKLNVD